MNEAQTRQNKIDPKSENRFWLQPANKYWLEQAAWSEWNMLEDGCSLEENYMVAEDEPWLEKNCMVAELGLEFHDGKLQLSSAWHGTEFLGTWLKPHRIYASRSTVGRMRSKLHVLAHSDRSKWYASLNSYCGVLSHWNNYRLRRRLLEAEPDFMRYGMFNMEYTKYDIAIIRRLCEMA